MSLASSDSSEAQAALTKQYEADKQAIEARMDPGKALLEDLDFELRLMKMSNVERSTAIAGKELGRADEDVRLLGNVVDRAAASARESASIASEITDNARRRMSEQSRDPITSASLPAPRSPGR